MAAAIAIAIGIHLHKVLSCERSVRKKFLQNTLVSPVHFLKVLSAQILRHLLSFLQIDIWLSVYRRCESHKWIHSEVRLHPVQFLLLSGNYLVFILIRLH